MERPALVLALVLAVTASSSAPTSSRRDASSADLHPGGATRAASGNFADARPRYHVRGAMVCADCHLAHTSADSSRGPSALVPADPLDVCLRCHDDQERIPDVVGADANGLRQRSAGHFAAPGVRNLNGHDLGRGLGAEDLCERCHGGGMAGASVTCTDCHDPHGNGVARNLRWASAPDRTPDLGLFTNPAASGPERYEARSVTYGTLDSDELREASSVCLDCHHVFSGRIHVDRDGDGVHERHPAYDSERHSPNTIARGRAKQTTSPAHWNAGDGAGFGETPRLRTVVRGARDFAGASRVDADRNGVFCLSCHRAHGSDQPFALTYDASPRTAPAGCLQCHVVGE